MQFARPGLQRAFGADTDLPATDVIMMQADGKGIALRPGHRKGAGGGSDAAHPGIKKMAEIVAVADFTPAVRDPEDIAALRPVAGNAWLPASPRQVGGGLDHRDHRFHDRGRVQ